MMTTTTSARTLSAAVEAVQASLAGKAFATINSDVTTNRDDSETWVTVALRYLAAATEAAPVSLAATEEARDSLEG